MTDFSLIARGMSEGVPLVGHLGLEVTSVAEGEAEVLLPARPELTNHVGSQHAGSLFSAAETASGAAFVGAFVERMAEVVPLVQGAEISYERVAEGPITAKAKLGMPPEIAIETLEADGKVSFPCEVELVDAEGELVATATVRWHLRRKEPAAA